MFIAAAASKHRKCDKLSNSPDKERGSVRIHIRDFREAWLQYHTSEITKLVQELSGQEYELKEATMYSSLKRLESDGNITSYWGDETQGGRRRYYHITPNGEKQYKVNKHNWNYAKKLLEKLL